MVESIDLSLVPANYMLGRSGSILMTRIGVQDANRHPVAYQVGTMGARFYHEYANQGGDYFGLPSGGNKLLTAPDNKNPRMSDPKSNIEYLGSWWDNQISSIAISGYGLVCTYTDNDYKGSESCFTAKGDEYVVNLTGSLAGQNDKISSVRMNNFYFALFSKLEGSLADNGTSSLPNSKLITSGPLSGFYGWLSPGTAAVSQLYSSNTASVIAVGESAMTVVLYAGATNGKRSMFFLGDGEWDVTYLNGIDKDVEGWYYWEYDCNVPTAGCHY